MTITRITAARRPDRHRAPAFRPSPVTRPCACGGLLRLAQSAVKRRRDSAGRATVRCLWRCECGREETGTLGV